MVAVRRRGNGQGGADGGVRTPGQEPTFHSSSDMNGCKEGEGLEIAVPLQSTCLEMEPWIICCLDSAGTSNMCGFFTGLQDEAILSIVEQVVRPGRESER